jgi:hypothetical protein
MKNTLLITIFIAGTLDIVAACLSAYLAKGTTPDRLLQYIASGIFGKSAYQGSFTMMAWGLFFHYLIAAACVVCFFWAYPQWSFLWKNIWLNALLIGIVAWLVTTQLVVPISHIKQTPFRWLDAVIAALILVVCMGLPVAIAAKNYYRNL